MIEGPKLSQLTNESTNDGWKDFNQMVFEFCTENRIEEEHVKTPLFYTGSREWEIVDYQHQLSSNVFLM